MLCEPNERNGIKNNKKKKVTIVCDFKIEKCRNYISRWNKRKKIIAADNMRFCMCAHFVCLQGLWFFLLNYATYNKQNNNIIQNNKQQTIEEEVHRRSCVTIVLLAFCWRHYLYKSRILNLVISANHSFHFTRILVKF